MSDKYVPIQYHGIIDKLFPYQKDILDNSNIFDKNKINFLYGKNIGKTSTAFLCEMYRKAINIPPILKAKEIIKSLSKIYQYKKDEDTSYIPSHIIYNTPYAVSADIEEFIKIIKTIENIKSKGYWNNIPNIWIFSSILPEPNAYLPEDKWNIYTINDKHEIIPHISNHALQ